MGRRLHPAEFPDSAFPFLSYAAHSGLQDSCCYSPGSARPKPSPAAAACPAPSRDAHSDCPARRPAAEGARRRWFEAWRRRLSQDGGRGPAPLHDGRARPATTAWGGGGGLTRLGTQLPAASAGCGDDDDDDENDDETPLPQLRP